MGREVRRKRRVIMVCCVDLKLRGQKEEDGGCGCMEKEAVNIAGCGDYGTFVGSGSVEKRLGRMKFF